MSQREQIRQLQVPTAVQRLPGVSNGPVRKLKMPLMTQQRLQASPCFCCCDFQSADGQGTPGETGI